MLLADWRCGAQRAAAYGIVCAATLAVAGCAEKDVTLNPADVANVRTVAVVGPQDPEKMFIQTQEVFDRQKGEVVAGSIFGAVGGLVAGVAIASEASAMSKPLNQDATAAGYHLGTGSQDEFVKALATGGFDAVRVDLKSGAGFADSYDGAKTSDVALDAVVTASCTNVVDEGSARFRPVVVMAVKLVVPATKKTIMKRTFVYDEAPPPQDATYIPVKGDPQFDYDTYEALEADPKRCLAGIEAGTTALAQAVVATMKPGVVFAAAPPPAIVPAPVAPPAAPSAPLPPTKPAQATN